MSQFNDITQLSAVDLGYLIRAKEVTCQEVTRAFLEKTESHDSEINSICTLDAEKAQQDANDLDRYIAQHGTEGRPLLGLPIVLKDLTPTAGLRTTQGSRLFESWLPSEDATLVTRLKAQGAVVLGKTNTPEFGHKAITDNKIFGPTRNPWNKDRIAGGRVADRPRPWPPGLCPLPREAMARAPSVYLPACAEWSVSNQHSDAYPT